MTMEDDAIQKTQKKVISNKQKKKQQFS